MEKRRLTKEDIDKVRGVEGFPRATDEAIIKLSDAPYYTACPNPFLDDFIAEYGTPYDEATDKYHREPYASDVSEGKGDPIYMAHSYHTKVPYKAIQKYILHYTNPGDVVLDAYCGTGMTGVASQSCKRDTLDAETLFTLLKDDESIGARKVILNDLSPAATFIAYNCNRAIDTHLLSNEIESWLGDAQQELGWIYETQHTNGQMGKISYVVFSQVVICPSCSSEMRFYDLVTANDTKSSDRIVSCLNCGARIDKAEFIRAVEQIEDEAMRNTRERVKRVPVKIFYKYGGKTFEKEPDEYDLKLLERIETEKCEQYPTDLMMFKGQNWGEFYRAGYHTGITRVHHFFSKRNLLVLAKLYKTAEKYEHCSVMRELIIASLARASIRNRYIPEYGNRHVGTLSGTLYVPSLSEEGNLIEAVRGRSKKILKAAGTLACSNNDFILSTGSITELPMPDQCVDYIFTDPPFGDNLIYSELNFITEAWMGIFTNSEDESIMANSQNKGIGEYKYLMQKGFSEYFRVLKPNRWMTVEFHNSKNAVWNAIQEAIQRAGFIIADVRVLDKKKGTTKQLSYSMAVKQDLVISAYKPNGSFEKTMHLNAGEAETAWAFVRQHLSNLPIAVHKDNALELIAERQNFLLFDRMVAYHVTQGIPVPLDATEFYRGLDDKFIKRDDMYFLPDQINEYDIARIKIEVEFVEFALLVTNEKTAIGWLYRLLSENAMSYQDIQPRFMQEVKTVDRYEDMPELETLLEENFLQDGAGCWYVPDVKKEGDVAKLREKALLKEFEGYLGTKGKLKLFRSEAIRVGFSRLWKDENYQAIVGMAERLPDATIQEDPSLLMYYDISLSRVGQ